MTEKQSQKGWACCGCSSRWQKWPFALTCSSNGVALAESLDIPKLRMGTCINSRASRDYCPDQLKFQNYKSVQRKIATADGRSLTAAGMGDLHIGLPNRSGKTKMVFKNAIHTPNMAFTLISVSWLDKASFSVTFNKAMCTIKTTKGQTIVTIPCSDGLYKLIANKTPNTKESASIASAKMTISKAHSSFGGQACNIQQVHNRHRAWSWIKTWVLWCLC